MGEGFLAGPPCQPFNTSGKRLAERDPRAMVFECIVEWIHHLAWTGELIWFCIENSSNIESIDLATVSKTTYAEFVLKQLDVGIPFFLTESTILRADRNMCMSRNRWWARGLRDLYFY